MIRNLLESGFVIRSVQVSIYISSSFTFAVQKADFGPMGPVQSSLCYEEAVANQLPAIEYHLLRGIGQERETICKLCGWTLQKPLTGSYKNPILKADKRM